MLISPETARARAIVLKESAVAALLREDQFRSDSEVGRLAGCGPAIVKRVRAEIADDDGLIPRPWVRPDLPRTPEEARAVRERDIDELIGEVSKLLSRIDELERENSDLKRLPA